MEIYTNAPGNLDYHGTTVVGDFGLGLLRIVTLNGSQTSATAQLQRYRDCGFFATLHRGNAIAFVTLQGRLEHPTVSDFHIRD